MAFILRFTGDGTPPDQDVASIRKLRGLSVLDESPEMLLVEASEPSLRALVGSLLDWSVVPEQRFKQPAIRTYPQKILSAKVPNEANRASIRDKRAESIIPRLKRYS